MRSDTKAFASGSFAIWKLRIVEWLRFGQVWQSPIPQTVSEELSREPPVPCDHAYHDRISACTRGLWRRSPVRIQPKDRRQDASTSVFRRRHGVRSFVRARQSADQSQNW